MKHSNICPLCDAAMVRVLELPKYPLTELYEPWEKEFAAGRGVVDQEFLLCEHCSHGKLGVIVPPEYLYSNYRTKSASSVGSMHALKNFVSFLSERAPFWECLIDIGGNDSTLVNMLPAMRRVVVDPNASGDAELFKCFIEDADLSVYKRYTKLFVSSHTLEHIEHPVTFMRKVNELAMHGDLLAIQVPSLEMLIMDRRIDQIHHQHIHYFSLRSLTSLLGKFGFEVVESRFDADHWGALMVVARRGKGEVIGRGVWAGEVVDADLFFRRQVRDATFMFWDREFVLLGAALMLPVLAYYMPELIQAQYIADDDESKNGLRYINFNKRITSDYSLRGEEVVITGVGSKMATRQLIAKAITEGAKNIVAPLHQI